VQLLTKVISSAGKDRSATIAFPVGLTLEKQENQWTAGLSRWQNDVLVFHQANPRGMYLPDLLQSN